MDVGHENARLIEEANLVCARSVTQSRGQICCASASIAASGALAVRASERPMAEDLIFREPGFYYDSLGVRTPHALYAAAAVGGAAYLRVRPVQ